MSSLDLDTWIRRAILIFSAKTWRLTTSMSSCEVDISRDQFDPICSYKSAMECFQLPMCKWLSVIVVGMACKEERSACQQQTVHTHNQTYPWSTNYRCDHFIWQNNIMTCDNEGNKDTNISNYPFSCIMSIGHLMRISCLKEALPHNIQRLLHTAKIPLENTE